MNVRRCVVQAVRLCSAIWSTWPLGLARITSSTESNTSKVKPGFGSTAAAGVWDCFSSFLEKKKKFSKDAVCDQTRTLPTRQGGRHDPIWLGAKRNTWHHADEGRILVTHGTNKGIKTWTESFPGWVIIPPQQGWWQRWWILFTRACQLWARQLKLSTRMNSLNRWFDGLKSAPRVELASPGG